ncbi:MAG: DUF2723 domain-containing protein [Bacteroidales bacterium]|nr:DUF2723 domain-containing protein [Bacteroidales bacterium]
MKKYHLVNNIIGWVVCIIACTVYILTAEATASWWDCGEYISTAFKLEVGHPPGAPTFQLIGRLFSMFSDPMTAAHAVNVMSAVCSGLTILFLFWGITLLGKHLLPDPKNPDVKNPRTWGVFAAGVVGALAYTFTDTFWFSAVEGEVYAMSSLFTSLVFWAILKWEEQADDPRSLRWLVLISLLVGVAIGVHLLNLLTLPAIVYVVYFKKWEKTTTKGFIISGIISLVLLAFILWGVIPGIVNVASAFDVFFVNSLHLPFNSGTIVFFALIIAAVVLGLLYAQKKSKPVLSASILGFVMLVIGYSTFFMLIIRANTNTPLNENAPKDAVAMRAYLGREQYGDTPLLYGQYYTAGDPVDVKEGYTKYVRGTDADGRDAYIEAAHAQEYIYNKQHCGLLPRMYSNDAQRGHPRYYQYWAGPVQNGQKPSMAQNIKYLNGYQLEWMYWRYFMWNFSGRQNDIQGHYFNPDGTRDYLNGNWITGINFLDEMRLGPQSNMPEHMQNNKGRNKYYMLPLILGLIGLCYHVKKHRKDAFIVLIMFVMTGLAIAVYLNMPPRQPRERDYAFVGSFCFFCIWIGLGVMALSEWITKLLKNEKFYKFVMPAVFVVSMVCVPCLLAAENWDDHDRSEKYAARDFAKNYLASVNKNGVLITFGDNDTFPLWYAQEVEGFRTDVRILNYTLSGMHWYVEQLYNKLYDSDALPFTLPKEFYALGRDVAYIQDNSNQFLEVEDVLKMVRDHQDRFVQEHNGQKYLILPTKRFKISVNKQELIDLGVITPADSAYVPNELRFEITKRNQALLRHELMILDILGTNHFRRDINIMSPTYIKDVYPLIEQGYCIQDGMNYKLTPFVPFYRSEEGARVQKRFSDRSADFFINGVDGEPLKWGNLSADIYVDPISLNMGEVQRQVMTGLADDLIVRGDSVRASKIIEILEENFPSKNFPHRVSALYIVPVCYTLYGPEKGLEMWNDIFDYYSSEIVYLNHFMGKKAEGARSSMREPVMVMQELRRMASKLPVNNPDLVAKVDKFFVEQSIM